MSRFVRSTQKYDQEGRKVPKGRDGIKRYKELYPNSIIFDSKNEYLTYLELKKQEQQKQIRNLRLQVPFCLIPKQRWWNNIKGKWEVLRPLVYVCDFVYERLDNFGRWQTVCLDCKGWIEKKDKKSGKTKWTCYYDDVYKVKKKIFLQFLQSKYPGFLFEER